MKKVVSLLFVMLFMFALFPIEAMASADYDSGYEAGYTDGEEAAMEEIAANRERKQEETRKEFSDYLNNTIWYGLILYGIYLLIKIGKMVAEEIVYKKQSK